MAECTVLLATLRDKTTVVSPEVALIINLAVFASVYHRCSIHLAYPGIRGGSLSAGHDGWKIKMWPLGSFLSRGMGYSASVGGVLIVFVAFVAAGVFSLLPRVWSDPFKATAYWAAS